MKYAVVGPGALGCLFACLLSEGMQEDDELILLDHNSERCEWISRNGITYQFKDNKRTIKVFATTDHECLSGVDVVFLCVKSYDLASCITRIEQFFSENSLVIFLQNGLSHLDYFSLVSQGTCVFGTTTEGANLIAPGSVQHAGKGETYLGFIGQEQDSLSLSRLAQVLNSLQCGGLKSMQTDQILSKLWQKFFVNVGINALTAINGCSNGELLAHPQTRELMDASVTEAMELGVMHDAPVWENDPKDLCVSVCKATGDNLSSMLQDVRLKRRTEIDAINGVVLQLADKYGLECPVNRDLYTKIKEIENDYL